MPIQHEDTCVPSSNPLQCAYYNKDHKIVNMLGYELVEEKILPAGSTQAVFNNLDGDEDEEYLIEGDINIVANGGDRSVSLLPNNLSTNQKGTRIHNFYNYTLTKVDITSLVLCVNGWSLDSTNHFTAHFYAKSGKKRLFSSESIDSMTDRDGGQFIRCSWNDTINNLTSLVVSVSSGGSINGIIRLFKKIPLDGGV